MKKIWIMRHGKSDRSNENSRDFDRPLAERGRRDSARMGKWIKSSSSRPEMVISSPARRAAQTAELVVQASDFKENIRPWDDLYPGEIKCILDRLKELPRRTSHVLLIGHNPLLEDLVSSLCSRGSLNLRLPTAALALLEAGIESWESLESGVAELEGLITPKLLGR